MKTSERLRKLRGELSLEAFAETLHPYTALSLSSIITTLSRIENGERGVPPSIAGALVDAYPAAGTFRGWLTDKETP